MKQVALACTTFSRARSESRGKRSFERRKKEANDTKTNDATNKKKSKYVKDVMRITTLRAP